MKAPGATPRPEALAALKPAFHARGQVTAGNSSQMSDGAAAVLLVNEETLRRHSLRPLARLAAYATAGVDPGIMGIGPVAAIPKALQRAGLKLDDIDLIELNEAFACQALAVIREAGLDPDRVNVNGGAIALGHPLGCTGAKLTTTLLHELQRRHARYGMVTMCVGGGMGAAGIFENLALDPSTGIECAHASGAVLDRGGFVTPSGGSFLFALPDHPFTPEDFNEEHQLVAQTAEEFALQEILPRSDAIEHQDFDTTRSLLRQAAQLGLTSVDVPEAYGGQEMDFVSSAIVADRVARQGSFAVSYGAHTGIGTLPIVYFGTEAQKQAYLPKLATGEWLGAYALTEPGTGSRRPGRQAAPPSPGRRPLGAERQEDVDHQRRLRRRLHRLRQGRRRAVQRLHRREDRPRRQHRRRGEEAGHQGQLHPHRSSCENCRVPKRTLLGEIGKGHKIAFDILNIGRFKLGARQPGRREADRSNTPSSYTAERRQFGKPINSFGLIQQKLADMATRIFVGRAPELSAPSATSTRPWTAPAGTARRRRRQAGRHRRVRHRVLASSKVWGSEALVFVADEAVQVLRRLRLRAEYPPRRLYRDCRINRIFEGTNEINRLLIAGTLLKRAMKGELPLMKSIQQVTAEVLFGPAVVPDAAAPTLVENARKFTLLLAGAAFQRYRDQLTEQQEVVAALSDLIIEVYAMQSALQRARLARDRGRPGRSRLRLLPRPSSNLSPEPLPPITGPCTKPWPR